MTNIPNQPEPDHPGDRSPSIQDLLDDLRSQTLVPRYPPEYEKAAVLSSYEPDDLEADPSAVRQVISDSIAVLRDEAVRFVLDPDVRRRVLQQLGSQKTMRETLDSVEDPPRDQTQRAIEKVVAGERLVDSGSTVEWLRIAYQVLDWFTGIVPTKELPESVRARIDAIGYLERFEELVGPNFRGRDASLRELEEYVGLSPTQSSLFDKLLGRATRGEVPALVICGPGGIGKSTLLAKFILDHVYDIPFVYANFDSPRVRAGDPKTILIEAARQLGIQFPDKTATISATRERWRTAVAEMSDLPETLRRTRERELPRIIVGEFVAMLSALGLARSPFLVMLDTFEVVQERQRGDVATLYAFLRRLQVAYPPLRVVISGRASAPGVAGIDDPTDSATLVTRVHELKGLDRRTSHAYLVQAGLPQADAARVAAHLVPEDADGASPLSLRVAAEVWRRDVERPDLDTTFWADLQAGRVQAQLITRYLRHTDSDSTAGRLALPAMLLRRIDEQSLLKIVAPAWRIGLAAADAGSAYAELAGLISLVLDSGGTDLRPRPDVQRQVVDLIGDLHPRRTRRLHDIAVDHYAAASERRDQDTRVRAQARFDEVVHRLARGDTEEEIRRRWIPECSEYVVGRIALVSEADQALLEQLAGIQLTKAMRATASRRIWEGDAITQARAYLKKGAPEKVIDLCVNRDDWDRAGDLALLVARAQLDLDEHLDALDTATQALEQTDPAASSALVTDFHLVAAEAACALERPQDVLAHTDDALSLAREREDPARTTSALLLKLEVLQHRDQRTATVTASELHDVLEADQALLNEKDETRLLTLLPAFPALVPTAVRAGGLSRLHSRATRQLGRAIAVVDQQASVAHGEEAGYVAREAGIIVRKSITATYQDLLDDVPGEEARLAVLHALDQDVPARTMLVAELASALAEAAAPIGDAETGTVQHAVLRLNGRLRRDLARALVAELGVEELAALMASELDRSLGSLAMLDAGPEPAVETMIETARDEGWLAELVIAVRNRLPRNAALLEIANELDLSTIHFAKAPLARAVAVGNRQEVLARLGDVEGRIGGVRSGDRLVGTGILVSPDLFLVATASLGEDPQQLSFTFGRKATAKGLVLDDGSSYSVDRSWALEKFPAGFALLQLEGFPADEPLGAGRGQRFQVRRGFVDLSRSAAMEEERSVFVCWQQAARLELHIQRRALRLERGRFLMSPPGRTALGAPCFSRDMELLGLLVGGKQATAEVVPAAEISESLREHGHGTVGMQLA